MNKTTVCAHVDTTGLRENTTKHMQKLNGKIISSISCHFSRMTCSVYIFSTVPEIKMRACSLFV